MYETIVRYCICMHLFVKKGLVTVVSTTEKKKKKKVS